MPHKPTSSSRFRRRSAEPDDPPKRAGQLRGTPFHTPDSGPRQRAEACSHHKGDPGTELAPEMILRVEAGVPATPGNVTR